MARLGWVVAGFAVPVAVAAAWIPVRSRVSNVDVALLLVLVVATLGLGRRRAATVAGAAGAAGGFAFFDTAPYEHWSVARQPDLETLVVLAVAALVTGELALRARRNGRPAEADLRPVREVAALVASGEELVAVIGLVALDVARLLRAAGCTYEAGAEVAGAALARPDGSLVDAGAPGPTRRVAVPVNGAGRTIGHFVATGVHGATPSRLQVAVTLADQVGAALIAQAPESALPLPEEPALQPTLRVVE